MKQSNKSSLITGIVLLTLAAFFSISLILQPLDFGVGGPGHNNILYALGHMLYSVYGFSSILIPVFLLISGLSCFATKWTARKTMRLLTALVPFFTAVITENIIRSILELGKSDFIAVKIIVALVTSIMLIVIEWIGIGILADKLNIKFYEKTGLKSPAAANPKPEAKSEPQSASKSDVISSEEYPKIKTSSVFDEALSKVATPSNNSITTEFPATAENEVKDVETITESKTETAENSEESEKNPASIITQDEYAALTAFNEDSQASIDELEWTNVPPAPTELPEDYKQEEIDENDPALSFPPEETESNEENLGDFEELNVPEFEASEEIVNEDDDIDSELENAGLTNDPNDENIEALDFTEIEEDNSDISFANITPDESDYEEQVISDAFANNAVDFDEEDSEEQNVTEEEETPYAEENLVYSNEDGVEIYSENSEQENDNSGHILAYDTENPYAAARFIDTVVENPNFPHGISLADETVDEFENEEEEESAPEPRKSIYPNRISLDDDLDSEIDDFENNLNSFNNTVRQNNDETDEDFIDDSDEAINASFANSQTPDKPVENKVRPPITARHSARANISRAAQNDEPDFSKEAAIMSGLPVEESDDERIFKQITEQENSKGFSGGISTVFDDMEADIRKNAPKPQLLKTVLDDEDAEQDSLENNENNDSWNSDFLEDQWADEEFDDEEESRWSDESLAFENTDDDFGEEEVEIEKASPIAKIRPRNANISVDGTSDDMEDEASPESAISAGATNLTKDDLTDFFNAQQAENTPKTKEILANPPKVGNRATKKGPYVIPSDLLIAYKDDQYWIIDEATKQASLDLKKTLSEFNIEAEIIGIKKGPVVTMFEILPAAGVKLSKIVALQDNIALSLAAQSVRIVAPIPGKQAVGIEVPNKHRSIVGFREIMEMDLPEWQKMAVPVVLGKDILGKAQLIDLVKTPHMLIAGATGSGKSVCVNSLILSILYKRSFRDVKLILVDPKVVELKLYNNIPHLLTPVITEPKKALQALQYCLCEMERRYALLDSMGVRDISNYNQKIKEQKIATEKLPYIVVIIDEFADLMATSGRELESTVARLTAMSRAVGIHLVLATQRPSVNVITGLIKANIPTRIAFMVSSRTDSNIIIDSVGAEKLLGRGDMLYASATDPAPVRIQGTFVSDQEVEDVVKAVKEYGEPDYIDDQIFVEDDEEKARDLFGDPIDDEDPLYDEALNIVVQAGKASASYLQRRLSIGYNRAARLVEEMEERGIVGPANGSKPREVIHIP